MSRPLRNDPQERPCVWVMAGVLNYRRPCHRNHECEECELYQALQGSGLGEEAGVGKPSPRARESGARDRVGEGVLDEMVSAYIVQLTEGCDLHLDRPYSSGHFWIKEEGPEE